MMSKMVFDVAVVFRPHFCFCLPAGRQAAGDENKSICEVRAVFRRKNLSGCRMLEC
ncbi:MAG: hypothetical protein UW71_C0018G0007 [Parcubacteria group bacterium GW2011_GWB1_44_7]|uniref:Uncharacterized protein n=1 Tax=Candidatus Giovannonibacteria bacterium GW2011_GWA2_45_21 TaxID=1618649 RepID=A0A0G1M882_9BACT|nr:MAG: hypothetical protein UW71_C0018G0007 [Parcubacteria group bacterium GW2011_GWB1_44_7]KKU04514.1 MAG: hypothetical protein UX06_C0016G0007 [Candidatus Giovannonibacteria bacterium GW2011_GWA2_45_21]